MFDNSKIPEIREHLSESELLAQLAEEAAELGQAALKLRRVMDGTNPTPLTESEARMRFVEEWADVLFCACCVLKDPITDEIQNIGTAKSRRWLRRLEEKHGL